MFCNSVASRRDRRAFGQCARLEDLENRLLFAADLRSLDGTGNNLLHPEWGSAGTALIRLAAAAYADGVSAPAGANRPSARAISDAVAAQADDMPSAQHLSAFAYLWGQFVDHDLDLTTTTSGATREALNIAVPSGDPQFDPTGSGAQVIPLSRSIYITDANGVRQQVNTITAYLDGSMIYGSDAARSAALRSFLGGHLKTSGDNLLPLNSAGLANANDAHLFADDQLFIAGDVRANENIELTALHTLFMREHNRLADQISAKHPTWNDEQVFQQARRLVVAEIQSITYNEWLPALLGRNALSRYTGYKANVNVGISNEFSTAAFRLGHSMLANDVEFLDNQGNDVRADLDLAGAFFNPGVVKETGIDSIMKYLASSNSEEIDTKVVDGVRNFLFGPPGAGGLDLPSLNIQRGRDHGLADYNTTRAAMGLAKVTSFNQITSDPVLAAKLKSLYGSVDNVDLWVGGLAEDHVGGSNLGATFQRIVVNQFTRLRDGDRFWFERDLTSNELSMVRGTSLADIIKANSTNTNLQDNVFVFNVTASGRLYSDRNGDGRQNFREGGLSGVTVNVLDEKGAVMMTTTTNRNGDYRFAGIQVGEYTLRPVVPSGWSLTTGAMVTMDVTRGMQFSNLNFGLQRVGGIVQPNVMESLGLCGADARSLQADVLGAAV
jgi:peroxidase